MKIRILFCIVLLAASTAQAQQPVLLLSLDGVRPDFITDADKYGLKIPTLRKLLRESSYATGVRGVLPTSTYPSHTTIMTGVWPVKHGIISNHPFDPNDKTPDLWYWFSEDIKVPTLWDAAADAGLATASINWPVSVGAKSVKFNIVEYNQTRTEFDLKMLRSLNGPILDELTKTAGTYAMDANKSVERDWSHVKFVTEMIRLKHPKFMTVHLAAVDHIEHGNGPFSKEAYESVEETDKMVATIHDAVLAEDSKFVLCIVSDHGFAPVKRALRLTQVFVKNGLIKVKGEGEGLSEAGVTNWAAMTWNNGGSSAIVLKNPDDAEVRVKVKKLLDDLAADENNGIDKVLDKPAIAKIGGTDVVDFWVTMRSGFMISGSLNGPQVSDTGSIGTHGYSPMNDDMRSTFLIGGEGIAKDKNVGEIDMRNIAPTVAKVLGVTWKDTDLPALDVFETNKP